MHLEIKTDLAIENQPACSVLVPEVLPEPFVFDVPNCVQCLFGIGNFFCLS